MTFFNSKNTYHFSSFVSLPPIGKHGSHLTLEMMKQAQQRGLDMITLPTHTSHALQPLNANCFKPFKNNLQEKKKQHNGYK